ncbi:protein-glutamate O-methyltransferase [Rhodobacter sp. Har01]|uniref:CheR family methyltransferase n=1 Tax=Rhodobacter sp. Har01 TaxID=2883999 RepID=UPI001D075667|nr:protein-glutamate O-methyltransferase [Rhodobacter sp. Har01]MCB6176780.1 protein-glutamate O-methyltransferase [Rhodobacter sp. Har01]
MLHDRDFARIAEIAYREFGLHLQSSKKELVQSRLMRRLRAIRCPDFSLYCDMISGPDGAAERAELVSALTTNVTHFFREEHHFRLLEEVCLTPVLPALRAGRRLRIWSAGCSAGPEPYSMAMTVLNLLPEAPRLDVRILATDIDPAILTRARAAVYSDDEVRSIPEPLRRGHLEPAGPGQHRIAARTSGLVHFAALNLMADWPVRGPFDAIFCRNVAIYFDKPTQERLWQRLASLLSPGGLLCIGHSERLHGPAADLLSSAGITAYRRAGDILQRSERTKR